MHARAHPTPLVPHIIEIAEHHHRCFVGCCSARFGGSGADGDSFGCSTIERVSAEPGALAVIERVASAVGNVSSFN
jgi:hypothetical protein